MNSFLETEGVGGFNFKLIANIDQILLLITKTNISAVINGGVCRRSYVHTYSSTYIFSLKTLGIKRMFAFKHTAKCFDEHG